MLRYLRIAVSVVSLVACVLLIVLWVRSHRAEDRLSGHFATSFAFRIYSSRGCIVCYAPNMPFQPSTFRGTSPWAPSIGFENQTHVSRPSQNFTITAKRCGRLCLIGFFSEHA